MEIQDFVEKVCLGVVHGMKEARKRLDHEIKIAPEAIEFDLVVAVESSKEINGKIKVLSYFGIGAELNSNNTFTHQVRFKMFVSSETIEEQDKRRVKLRKQIEEGRNLIR